MKTVSKTRKGLRGFITWYVCLPQPDGMPDYVRQLKKLRKAADLAYNIRIDYENPSWSDDAHDFMQFVDVGIHAGRSGLKPFLCTPESYDDLNELCDQDSHRNETDAIGELIGWIFVFLGTNEADAVKRLSERLGV